MNLGSFSLRNLKQRDIAIIILVLTLILGAVWFFYLYRPTIDRVTELNDEIESLNARIEEGERARRNLPALRLAVAELEQDRLEFLAELPRESDVAGLLDQLRGSANNADVLVNAISQGTANEEIQGVRPISFTVQTAGTYTKTMGFLEALEDLQRFTKIQQVALSANSIESDDPDLQGSFGFTVYVFTGEDPGARP